MAVGDFVSGVIGGIGAARQAKRAKRAERLTQAGIIQTTAFRTRSLQREAQRQLGRERAAFGAAGVSGTAGSAGLLSLDSLFETIEEVTLLQEVAFLELLASRQRQKQFSSQERLARIATVASVVGLVSQGDNREERTTTGQKRGKVTRALTIDLGF